MLLPCHGNPAGVHPQLLGVWAHILDHLIEVQHIVGTPDERRTHDEVKYVVQRTWPQEPAYNPHWIWQLRRWAPCKRDSYGKCWHCHQHNRLHGRRWCRVSLCLQLGTGRIVIKSQETFAYLWHVNKHWNFKVAGVGGWHMQLWMVARARGLEYFVFYEWS